MDGELVDELGEGFEGLHLTLSAASLTEPILGKSYPMDPFSAVVVGRVSDAGGGFYIDGLVPGHYKLIVEPNGYNPRSGPDEAILGKVMNAVDVEVFPGVNSVRIEVPRAAPVRVWGRVGLKDVGPAGRLRGARSPILTLVVPKRSAPDSRVRIVNDKITGFSFYLEARFQDAYLELSLGGERAVVPMLLPTAHSGLTERHLGTIHLP